MSPGPERRLRWNPTTCTAAGYCVEVAPELIFLDEWGYPVVEGRALSDPELAHARRAVAVCPRQALLVQELAWAES